MSQDSNGLGDFLSDVETTLAASEFCSLHYIGISGGDTIRIEKARLRLHNVNPISERRFSVGAVAAGELSIDDIGVSTIEAINGLASGFIKTPHGKIILPTDLNNGPKIFYHGIHAEGLQNQNRLSVLTIFGAKLDTQSKQPRLDWILRAADKPYNSLQELAFDFHCGSLSEETSTIEIVADNILFVDAQSTISERTVHLWLRMAMQLNTDRAVLGYRLLVNGAVAERNSISGRDFAWENVDEIYEVTQPFWCRMVPYYSALPATLASQDTTTGSVIPQSYKSEACCLRAF